MSNPSHAIKAVIFDMDGVLIEAKEWHYEALNRALALFGYTISRYDHLITYDGLPTRAKLEMLSREADLPESLHAFINEMKQIYTMEMIHAHCRPIFQHEYALSRLRAMGYRLGVASNSINQTVQLMMEKSNLKPYLEVLLSNEHVSKGKPDPEIYIKAISMLGLQPEQCLVVEDNEKGIRAAREAGAHVLEVTNVTDVTIDRILERIARIEAAKPAGVLA